MDEERYPHMDEKGISCTCNYRLTNEELLAFHWLVISRIPRLEVLTAYLSILSYLKSMSAAHEMALSRMQGKLGGSGRIVHRRMGLPLSVTP
jgi:hypothetical protein